MLLTSTIVVQQSIEQVWNFLSDPLTSNKWDKSIDHVILPEWGFTGLGCVVETVSPSGMRQSFVITEFRPPELFKFQLLKSSMFRDAELSFLIEQAVDGTRITHEINFKLHFRWLVLYPVLLFTSKKALGTDLEYLKKALNKHYSQ